MKLILKAPLTVSTKDSKIKAEVYLCQGMPMDGPTLEAIVNMACCLIRTIEKENSIVKGNS